MTLATVTIAEGFSEWREVSRSLLARRLPPAQVTWLDQRDSGDLFAGFVDDLTADMPENTHADIDGSSINGEPQTQPAKDHEVKITVPATFLQQAAQASHFSDPARWSLLYRLLWRQQNGERQLMKLHSDSDVQRLRRMASAVRRDAHKLEAFLRFREVIADDGEPWFIAWFEPDHYTLEYKADFLTRRFASMRFSVLTPYRCLHWDKREIRYSKGAYKDQAPKADELEDIWRTYYANIFNPARLKLKAMQSEMPKKYWKNLPEAALIGPLTAAARARTASMIAAPASPSPLPLFDGAADKNTPAAITAQTAASSSTLTELNKLMQQCRGCSLHERATQAVTGLGPENASLVIVGEQPGDKEDLQGKPFVGPAGQLLKSALEQAGIDRSSAWLTNAVKHFKWEAKGKIRLHARPNAREITACQGWVKQELAIIQPAQVLLLGATAARSVLGPGIKISESRGEWFALPHGGKALLTVHPSWILRIDKNRQADEMERFVAELSLLDA